MEGVIGSCTSLQVALVGCGAHPSAGIVQGFGVVLIVCIRIAFFWGGGVPVEFDMPYCVCLAVMLSHQWYLGCNCCWLSGSAG